MSNPKFICAQFLLELPATIKNDALLFVMIYGFGLKPPIMGQIADVFEAQIKSDDTFGKLGVAVRLTGVVDFVLRQLVHGYQLNESRLPLANAMFEWPDEIKLINQQKILQLGLQEAHARRALEAWTVLRANELSYEALIDHLIQI